MNRLFLTAFAAAFVGVMMVGQSPAHAYLGPGMGAGTIGVVLGIIGAFFLALFAVIWYPFKRMLRRKREQKEASQAKATASPTTAKTVEEATDT